MNYNCGFDNFNEILIDRIFGNDMIPRTKKTIKEDIPRIDLLLNIL